MWPAIGPRISASWSLGLAWALVAASRGGYLLGAGSLLSSVIHPAQRGPGSQLGLFTPRTFLVKTEY